MAKSILGLVGLAVTLAFAVPIALFGLSLLGRGQTLWGGFALAVAVLMVVMQEYITTPGDIPGKVAERVVGTVVKEPEEGSDE